MWPIKDSIADVIHGRIIHDAHRIELKHESLSETWIKLKETETLNKIDRFV
jgi:hypothetical protein